MRYHQPKFKIFYHIQNNSAMQVHLVPMNTLHCVQVWTPKVITLWEALLTVLQYGLLLLHAYAQDKRWPFVSIPLYDPNS